MALTNEQKSIINRMNRRALKVGLGTEVQNLGNLINGFKIVNAQLKTTVGTAAIEDVAISGVVATDVCLVLLHTAGSTPRSIVSAVCATGKVTITFSGDPSTDHVVNILVIRPA